MLSSLLGSIGEFCIKLTNFLGYPGIFILMALESMVFPLPSELIMPFAGYLVAQGRFNFWLVVLASSLGSIFGSLLSYYIGKYGGNKVVLRWGKYLFLDVVDLEKTEQWFKKSGEKTIFISRFIPVVRHLISIPAGMGKMNLNKFCIYTLAGATLWNTFLAYLGYLLGENWEFVKQYSEYVSLPVGIIIIFILAYFVYRHIRDRKKSQRISNFSP